MKLNRLFPSAVLAHARGTFLAGLSILAVVALASSALFTPARAAGGSHHDDEDGQSLAQVAEVQQLLTDFHGALSYGGDITAMMSLWADDSSITLNGVAHIGKPAVQTFFTSGGYFLHNWVSLAPEYKTQITVHGHTAEATTQCVAVDVDPSSPTFHHVLSVIQVNATAERHEGKWLFTSMNNTSPAPL
jgi:hypothetical protein